MALAFALTGCCDSPPPVLRYQCVGSFTCDGQAEIGSGGFCFDEDGAEAQERKFDAACADRARAAGCTTWTCLDDCEPVDPQPPNACPL